MAGAEKLRNKLLSGSISCKELRVLLSQEGWELDRTKGSHEVWVKEKSTLVLALHSKDLKPYQIREARAVLLLG